MSRPRIKKGTLFVVSAPSGAGKSTLCKLLLDRMEGIGVAVSHTTRAPRTGEADGHDYHFVTREKFELMVEAGEFLEWAEVHGNFYGTSKAALSGMLDAGMDVLHDIDVQGARQLRAQFPGAVYVFVLPPGAAELAARLRGRGTDSAEVIRRRLANAVGEIGDYGGYDYVIINDALEEAVADFSALVRAARLRSGRVDPLWVERNFLSGHEEDA